MREAGQSVVLGSGRNSISTVSRATPAAEAPIRTHQPTGRPTGAGWTSGPRRPARHATASTAAPASPMSSVCRSVPPSR